VNRASTPPRRPLVITRNSSVHLALLGVVAVAVVVAIVSGSRLQPFDQGQVTRVLIYAIAIAGLNVATGYTGMISVGHSAFFGLGAYTTGILVVQFGWQATYTLPVAVAVCFLVGLVVGLPALRIRGLYFAMVTLAFGVAFPELIDRFPELTGGSSGLTIRRTMLRPPEWTGLALGRKDLWLYWLSAVLFVVVMLLLASLVRSRYGLALVAVRDNEIAAAASGVNLAVVKTVSFGLSGGLAGLAGGLFAMFLGSLVADDSFTLLSAIVMLTGLVIGGQGTLMGPLVGGVVVVYLPYYTSDLGQGQASAVLFGAALIAIIFVAPQGIVGGALRLAHRYVRVQPSPPRHPRDAASRYDHPTSQPVTSAAVAAASPSTAGRSEDA
jgi:branched-chain amino acid transport system permease protein